MTELHRVTVEIRHSRTLCAGTVHLMAVAGLVGAHYTDCYPDIVSVRNIEVATG